MTVSNNLDWTGPLSCTSMYARRRFKTRHFLHFGFQLLHDLRQSMTRQFIQWI